MEKIKIIITKPIIFKIATIIMMFSLFLMNYNPAAFIKYAGIIGLGIFNISLIIMILYLLYTAQLYKNLKINNKINISSFFILTGITFLLSLSLKMYTIDSYELSLIEKDFFQLNLGYILYGSYLAWKNSLFNKNIKIWWVNSSIIATVTTLILQIYLINYKSINTACLDIGFCKVIIQIIGSGPSN